MKGARKAWCGSVAGTWTPRLFIDLFLPSTLWTGATSCFSISMPIAEKSVHTFAGELICIRGRRNYDADGIGRRFTITGL